MESRGHKFHVGNLSLYLDPVDGKLRARVNMMVYRKEFSAYYVADVGRVYKAPVGNLPLIHYIYPGG